MYTLLLLAVLLTVLSEPVAASSPIMDLTMPGTPLESIFPETDNMFNPLCELCCMPLLQCMHAIPQLLYVPADIFFNEPAESFHMPLLDHQTPADFTPLVDWVTHTRQPLLPEHLRNIDANETSVQPTTIQAHIEETYTPGDRLPTRRPGSRKAALRRQAPRPGGFSCNVEGCDKAFDRQCELNRHQKTHLDRSERPHKCSACNDSFLYPKDLHRHQRKHSDPSSALNTYRCSHPHCTNLDGFSRKDNLLRHQRKQHPTMVAAA